MLYIRCNNCDKLNHFKTEYLTFCEHCGKKLRDNFPDWKQKHPGKSLENFKEQVCVTEDAKLADNTLVKKKKPAVSRKAIIITAGVIAGVAFIITMRIAGPMLIEKALDTVRNLSYFQEKWEKATYGKYGLSVETPGKCRETKVELPPEVQPMVEDFAIFEYIGIDGINVLVTTGKYRPESGGANITNAANGAISNIRMQAGVTNVDFSETPFGKSGVPGIRLDGSANENGKDQAFLVVICCKDLNLWQLTISYPVNSEKLKRDAERIVQSMSIDYNPNLQSL